MLQIATSPDADDLFMFWALETGRITHPYSLSFVRYDTETLNRRALQGLDEITAVSAGVLPRILDRYRLLPHGASIGQDYGPVVVEVEDAQGDWREGPVAIPGEHTTAARVLRQMYPAIPTIEVPITPFSEAFACLRDGRARASLVIHEGRLTYQRHDCRLVADIGQLWQQKTGLPLVLGVNVIRRDIPAKDQRALEKLIAASIREGLAHRDEALPWLLKHGTGSLEQSKEIAAYLDLYANQDTLSTPTAAVAGLQTLFAGDPDAPPLSELDGSYWFSNSPAN